MNKSDAPIGWRANLEPVLAAGLHVRRIPVFDEDARSREVERRLAKAGQFPLWPLFLALPAFAAPNGAAWAIALVVGWAAWYAYVKRRASRLNAELAAETERLRNSARALAEETSRLISTADQGDPASLQTLLNRWLENRPPCLRHLALQLNGRLDPGWSLFGEAVRRDDLPAVTPRIGRSGRTFYSKRKAGELDEDVAELNAAAILSVLIALFSGPILQRVSVRLMMAQGDSRIPWVSLVANINGEVLAAVLNPISSAVEALRWLGGNVGRSRAQRLTAAQSEVASADPRTSPERGQRRDTPRTADRPAEQRDDGSDVYGTRAAPVDIGEPPAEARSHRIPNRPDYVLGSPVGLSRAVPSPKNVRGEFSTVARRFAAYRGEPNALFVPFQAYWSTYADMTGGQLKFYFKWRNAVRTGEVPRTDLSYVFVHVFELLHGIGATSAEDAGAQLESVWKRYRVAFPKLDAYLVRWIADYYAAEVSADSALVFLTSAVGLGANAASEDAMLVVDRYWERASYTEMPGVGLSILAGDPRLGDNKFYREHNRDGWVDRAYREAFAVADSAYAETQRVSPRDAVIAANGVHQIVREAFQGAVYDWKRKHVILGTHPRLTSDSIAVSLYRNAVRHAENLLRAERQFGSRLRGIELDTAIASAIEARIGQYIRSSRPRTRIVIDPDKALHLTATSAEVRARLLAGMEGHADEESASSVVPPDHSVQGNPVDVTVPADAPPGLLTDLAHVKKMLAQLDARGRAIVDALMNSGWELPAMAGVITQAAEGALIAPLVDHINETALASLGDVLLVQEGDALVVQEDYRDELYWLNRGTLQGFDLASSSLLDAAATVDQTDSDTASPPESFGALELEALAVVANGHHDMVTQLSTLAAAHGTTPLLLLDRVNESALMSSHEDLIIDVDQSPPRVLHDAAEFVEQLLSFRRVRLSSQSGGAEGEASDIDTRLDEGDA